MKLFFFLALAFFITNPSTIEASLHKNGIVNKKKWTQPSSKIIYALDEVQYYLSPKSLVCLDVDDLLVRHQHLGSPGWKRDRLQAFSERFIPYYEATSRLLKEAVAISFFKKKELTEKRAPALIQEIIDLPDVSLMGISSCGLESVESTIQALSQVNIHFDSKPLFPEDFFLKSRSPLSQSAAFINGILFCGILSETEAFTEMWVKEPLEITKVIFVHSSPETVKEMEKLTQKLGLEFVGLIYYPSSQYLFNYGPPYSIAIAMQSESALQVLTDDIATQVLEFLSPNTQSLE